jgi:hypothetical protein
MAEADTKRPMTYDHLKSTKKRTRRSVWIAMDEMYVEELDERRRHLEVARQRANVQPTNVKFQTELKEA